MSENTNQSSIVSALYRLERAGSEHSASTAKLIRAAGTLGNAVAQLVPHAYWVGDGGGITNPLPRGYYADEVSVYSVGADDGIIRVEEDRASALAFAADVADDWLDELATWLEARSAQDSVAVATLERAAAGLREEVQP